MTQAVAMPPAKTLEADIKPAPKQDNWLKASVLSFFQEGVKRQFEEMALVVFMLFHIALAITSFFSGDWFFALVFAGAAFLEANLRAKLKAYYNLYALADRQSNRLAALEIALFEFQRNNTVHSLNNETHSKNNVEQAKQIEFLKKTIDQQNAIFQDLLTKQKDAFEEQLEQQQVVFDREMFELREATAKHKRNNAEQAALIQAMRTALENFKGECQKALQAACDAGNKQLEEASRNALIRLQRFDSVIASSQEGMNAICAQTEEALVQLKHHIKEIENVPATLLLQAKHVQALKDETVALQLQIEEQKEILAAMKRIASDTEDTAKLTNKELRQLLKGNGVIISPRKEGELSPKPETGGIGSVFRNAISWFASI